MYSVEIDRSKRLLVISALRQVTAEQAKLAAQQVRELLQDVATAHWRAVASPDAQENIAWVVLRHEIDYKAPAILGDEVVLGTWVGKATRLTFERFTEIRRNRDGRLLSKARTLWCPINVQQASVGLP